MVTYREYREGDIPAILELFEHAFHHPRTEARFRWQFEDGPWGKALLRTAWDKDRLVGFLAGMPTMLNLDGQEHLTYQVVDLMTRQEYQGARVLQNLNSWVRVDMLNQGATFKLGFPNSRSIPIGVAKFSWELLFPIPVYTAYLQIGAIPKKMQPMFQAYVKLLFRRWIDQDEIQAVWRDTVGFGEEYDTLWERIHNRYGVATQRTAAYLDWRYRRHPEYSYWQLEYRQDGQLAGYAIVYLSASGDRASILELISESPQGAAALAAALSKSLAEKGVARIQCWASPQSPLGDSLKRLGYWARTSGIYQVLEALTEDATLPFVRQPSHWFITQGDSDTR